MRVHSVLLSWIVLVVVGCLSANCHADLIITGVVDGTQSGGNPKAMELMATADIVDLSNFFVLRFSPALISGDPPILSSSQLPNVVLNAGDFYYIYGNAATETYLESLNFGNTMPDFATALPDAVLSHDGDDILAVATANDGTGILDAFGLLGQTGTFAADSIAYRQPNTAANPTGVLDAGNFDLTSYTDLDLTSTFGTYQLVAVPEPSALLFGGLLCSLFFMKRSR